MKNDRDQRELLLSLGWLYIRCGHHRRGLVLVLLAALSAPEDIAAQRALAWALVVNGSGEEALATLDALEPGAAEPPDPAIKLLRSRALWLTGRTEAARRCFAEFVALRGGAA